MVTKQPHTGTRPGRGAPGGWLSGSGLARVVLAAREGCAAWARRHPRLVDAALVAMLLSLSGPNLRVRSGHEALTQVLIFATMIPLVWRRRAPFLVLMIIVALIFTQLFVSREVTDDVAVLVAFYTVAAYQSPQRVLAAAGLLGAGGAAIAAQNAPPGIHVLWVWMFMAGLVTAAGFLGYYARTRRAHLAALVDRAERLERERDQEAQLAASAERARIAREVHDIVAHNIAVMIALADGAAYTAVASPDQAVTIMGQVSATGRSALAEMRRLLGVMRQPGAPEHAPPPALADLDDLLATVQAAGLPAMLSVTGQPYPLPSSAQLALYRIAQEALTNTIKHAGATLAQVHLSYRPGEIGLEVTDDGHPAAGAGGGHGLAGMRERAAVFGADVSAGPAPGGGWRVHTVLHLEPGPPDPGPVAPGAVAPGPVAPEPATAAPAGREPGRPVEHR
jgi:signal transduction histidine kinase